MFLDVQDNYTRHYRLNEPKVRKDRINNKFRLNFLKLNQ